MLKQSYVQQKLSDLASAEHVFNAPVGGLSERSGRDGDSRPSAALRFGLNAAPVDLDANERFPESSRAASDYYYKNNIKFIQAQHQEVLVGLQEELELTKEKNRALLFRLNVAPLGGGSDAATTAADAKSLLKGDLEVYQAENRHLLQLLELNEKKNKYLLDVIADIEHKMAHAGRELAVRDEATGERSVEDDEDDGFSVVAAEPVSTSQAVVKMPASLRPKKNKDPVDELEQTRRNRQTRKLQKERHRKDYF